ncbi:MAG: TonB-dependent receptor [Acidobacteria bacterium]|nr:TonB-dependent receptor [Acidobacteriota bacterium]
MSNRISLSFLAQALVASSLVAIAPAAGATGDPADSTLAGSVRAPDGTPLPAAEIRLDGELAGTSDGEGRFRVPAAAGEHRLAVRLAGYRDEERRVAGGEMALEVVLEPLASFSESVVVAALRAGEAAPFAVSELSAIEIERADYGQEMPLLLGRTPAVASYSETGLDTGGGYSYFTLRGLNQARVNMTFDGVPLNDPEESAVYFANFGDFAGAVSAIQVQRGVGASSVGAASYGGAIHFESTRIEEESSLGLGVGGGAYGTGRAHVAWQSGRGNSGFAFQARVAYQETDGWREHSGLEQRSLYFGGDWRGERTYLRIAGFSGREESSLAFYAVEPEILSVDPRYNPMQPEETDDFGQDLVYLQIARQLSERAELAAQVYYSGAQGSLELFDDPAAKAGLTEYGIDGETLGALVTANLRHDRWRLDAGVHGSTFSRDHFAFAEDGSRLYANVGEKDELSGFAKLDYEVAPRWRLFADLQLRQASFRYRGAIDLPTVRWGFVNPRLGVRYTLRDGLSLRASVGRSGREPARNDLLAGQDDVTTPIDLEAVRPERVTDYELGIDWRGERAALAAGLYAMEFRDEIAVTGELSDFGYPIRRNLPESSRRGLEVELELDPAPAWRLVTTANLARNRIDTWRQSVDVYDAAGEWVGSELVTVRDTEPALSPATILGQRIEWSPTDGLWLELAARYVSSSQLDNLGEERLATPSYTWVDLSVRWSLARWIRFGAPRLSVRVANLLDEERVWASGYSYPYLVRDGDAATLDGIPYYYPQAPRHVVAGLEFSF